MGWLFRKNNVEVPMPDPKNRKVEIIAHKKATQKTVDDIQEVNKKLNQIFNDNHFTLKIYLAAGGSNPKKPKGAK